jgi:hypothetical protein
MSRCVAHPTLSCTKHGEAIKSDLPITDLLELSKEQIETSEVERVVQVTLDRVDNFFLQNEWTQLRTTEDLFRFCIQYGCLDMLSILYQQLLYKYNFSILEHIVIRCPIMKQLQHDKKLEQTFYRDRQAAINYLYELRRYSRMCIFGGEFYYQYHPRAS